MCKNFDENYIPTSEPKLAVNATEVDSNARYLVLKEFVSDQEVLQSNDAMSHCDVACLLFDTHDARSLQHVQKVQAMLKEKYPFIPSVLLETKSDLSSVNQV